jgi:hypothetical protein
LIWFGDLGSVAKGSYFVLKHASYEVFFLPQPELVSPTMVTSPLLILLSAVQVFAQQTAWGQCKLNWLFCRVEAITDLTRWRQWMDRRNNMRLRCVQPQQKLNHVQI